MPAQFTKQLKLSTWRKIALHTWRGAADPTVYGTIEFDMGNAQRYLAAVREKTGAKVTVTHLIGKAVAIAIAERPEVNAVIRRGRHVYLRDTIDVFFQVAMDGGEDLSGAKVT